MSRATTPASSSARCCSACPPRRAPITFPWATYTDPELAQVGLTEAQAREKHGDKALRREGGVSPQRPRHRHGQTEGFAKVMVVKGKPVGATIVGPQAGELIQIWALAIANGLKMSAVAGMVAPYPTLGEINKRAAGAYFSPKLFDSPVVKRVVDWCNA
jgi:pyruvate/2-oxoglutarate dehydrogenase complex dihydrolipoamide dehydrogenase (E3) component